MKNRSFAQSLKNALNGIMYTVKSERNMKIHVAAAVLITVMGFFFNLQASEWMMVCLAIALVLVCELFNTAVENVVDMIVDGYNPKAKIAKDIAAGAVLVSAVFALATGYLLFGDRLLATFRVWSERLFGGI